MSSNHTKPKDSEQDRIIAEARRSREVREAAYREQALRMYPHICARCGREFDGKKLRELTVHHKDHNHENDPPDGSNWELLCLYCHDNEHQKYLEGESSRDATPDKEIKPAPMQKPFAALEALLKNLKKEV